MAAESMIQYGTLDQAENEVRLLAILPVLGAPVRDSVQCRLEKYSLDQPSPNYIAVSYTWGNPSPTDEMIVDGKLVRVGANLGAALRTFRHATQGLFFWVRFALYQPKRSARKKSTSPTYASNICTSCGGSNMAWCREG